MRRYDLPRLLREAEQDLFRFSAWCGKVGDAMRFIGPLLALALVGVGGYFTRNLWITINVPLLVLILFLTPYFVILIARSRLPELEVGELMADNSSPSFDVRVKNLGPGKIRPVVTFMLWDGKGRQFRHAPESYREREAHWRHGPNANWRPRLRKGAEANAGVLWVDDAETDHPVLCTYPNDLRAKFPLWDQPIPLKDQNGLRLRIVVSYLRSSGRDARSIECNYLVIPDETQLWKYRIQRVETFN